LCQLFFLPILQQQRGYPGFRDSGIQRFIQVVYDAGGGGLFHRGLFVGDEDDGMSRVRLLVFSIWAISARWLSGSCTSSRIRSNSLSSAVLRASLALVAL